MTYHEAEKAYEKYLLSLKALKSGCIPPRPKREILNALRKHDAEVKEYNEYIRLKVKYE